MNKLIKKAGAIVLSAAITLSSVCAYASNDNISLSVNNIDIKLTNNIFMLDDHIMIPVRSFMEFYDYLVSWNEQTNAITLLRADTEITLNPGSDVVSINGVEKKLSHNIVVINGVSYAPVSFVKEIENTNIIWEADKNKVSLLSDGLYTGGGIVGAPGASLGGSSNNIPKGSIVYFDFADADMLNGPYDGINTQDEGFYYGTKGDTLAHSTENGADGKEGYITTDGYTHVFYSDSQFFEKYGDSGKYEVKFKARKRNGTNGNVHLRFSDYVQIDDSYKGENGVAKNFSFDLTSEWKECKFTVDVKKYDDSSGIVCVRFIRADIGIDIDDFTITKK